MLETEMRWGTKQSRLQDLAFFLLVFLQSSVLRLLAFFSYDVIVVAKNFQSRRKVNFQGVGLLLSSHSFTKITFIANNTLWVNRETRTVIVKERYFPLPGIFLSSLSSTVNDIRRKLYMVRHTQLQENEQKECQILLSRLLTNGI